MMIINLALNWLAWNYLTYWRIHRKTLDTKMHHDLVTSHHDGSHQLTYVEIIVLTLNKMSRTKVIRFDITFLMCAIESTLWFKVNIVLKVSIEDFFYFLNTNWWVLDLFYMLCILRNLSLLRHYRQIGNSNLTSR